MWPPCGHCVATVWPPCGHRWHSICVRLVACTLALWLSCLPALLLACLPDRGHFARWLAYLAACLPTCLAQQAQQARRPTRWQRGVEQPMKMTMIPAIMTCGGWLPRATNERNHDTCEYDGGWYAQRLGEAVTVYAPLSRVPCRGPVSCKLRSELGFRTPPCKLKSRKLAPPPSSQIQCWVKVSGGGWKNHVQQIFHNIEFGGKGGR